MGVAAALKATATATAKSTTATTATVLVLVLVLLLITAAYRPLDDDVTAGATIVSLLRDGPKLEFKLSMGHDSENGLHLVLQNKPSFLDDDFRIIHHANDNLADETNHNGTGNVRISDCYFTGVVRGYPQSRVSLMRCENTPMSGEIYLSQTLKYRISSDDTTQHRVTLTRIELSQRRLLRRDDRYSSSSTSRFRASNSRFAQAPSPFDNDGDGDIDLNGSKGDEDNFMFPQKSLPPVRYIRIKLGVENDVVETEGKNNVVAQVMQYAHRIAEFFGPDGLDVGLFRLKPIFKRVYVFNLSPFSEVQSAGDYLRDWCASMGPRRRLRERIQRAGSLRDNMGYRNKDALQQRFEDDYNAPDAVDVSMIVKAERLSYSQPISGLSYVNTTCSTMACGIVFTLGKIFADDAPVDNVGVFAHELVHTLGAWNDGQREKGNYCPQGYLMGGARNRALSECTLRELRQSLRVENTRCLRRESEISTAN